MDEHCGSRYSNRRRYCITGTKKCGDHETQPAKGSDDSSGGILDYLFGVGRAL